MFRWRQCVIVLAVVFVSGLVVGCRKEKEVSEKKAAPRESVDERARKAGEKAVRDYLDALAGGDYRGAVEFIDVEEMLETRQPGATTSPPPGDIEGMKEKFLQMMEMAAKQQKGKLTYKILASRVSDGKVTVEVDVYRDGKLMDSGNYALAKREGEWKIAGSAAIRALMPPAPGIPQ